MNAEERATLRQMEKQFDAIRAMPAPIPKAERHRHTIENAREGGYLRIAGELYRVALVSHYQEKKSRWYELELFGLASGETRYVEWERDDEVEVSINEPKRKLRDLGLDADEIEAMSDEEKGSIRFDGRTFHYDDDYGAVFFRGGEGEGEKVYSYDFETSDERYCLTVEEWGSESEGYEYEVYVSEYVDVDAVEVLATG